MVDQTFIESGLPESSGTSNNQKSPK